MRSISTNDSDGPGTSTPCHSDNVPNSEVRVGGELLDQRGGAVVALTQHRRGQPSAHGLGGSPGGPHRREQPQGPPAGRGDELGDFGQLLGRAGAVAARRREMGGDVEDSRLGVVERRSDVEATPLGGVSGHSPASSPVRPQAAAIASKDPPTVSVADVNTVAERENTRSRSSSAPTAEPPAAPRAANRGCPPGPARPRRCDQGSRG